MLLRDSATLNNQHKRILWATSLGWIFDFFDFVLFTMLLGAMSKSLHFSKEQTGVALGLSLLFTAIGGIVLGYVADKIGRKKTLILAITIYSLGGLMTAFTFSYGWLLLARAVTGFGVGGEWGVGQSLIAETTPAKYRGRFGAIMHSGLSMGIILAYLLAAFVVPHLGSHGWRIGFAFSIVAALIVLPVLSGIPESDLWKNRTTADRKVPISMIFQGRTKWYGLLGLVFMTFEFTGYWLLTTWFPTYLQEQRHMSIAHSALWLILLNIGGLIGYSSTGFISDRFGRRRVLTVYKLIEAAAVLPITIFWTGNTSILLICMFFIGFGGGGTAIIGPLLNEIAPAPVRTTMSNSIFNIARGLQYYTPIIAVAWAASVGFGTVLSTASIFFVIMAIIVWLFPETKGKELDA